MKDNCKEIKQKPFHFVKMSEHHLWDLSLTTCPFYVKLCSLLDAFCCGLAIVQRLSFLLLHLITFTLAFTNGNFLQIFYCIRSLWIFPTYSRAYNMYSFHSWINIIVTQNYLCDFIYHSMFEPPERQKEPSGQTRVRATEKNGNTAATTTTKKCSIN